MGKFKVLAVMVCILISAALLGKYVVPKYIIYNATSSMEIGFYLLHPNEKVKKGDIAIITMPDDIRKFIIQRNLAPAKATTLIKHVIGLGGDYACVNGGRFVVDGIDYGTLKEKDSAGRAVPRKPFCKEISEGQMMIGTDSDGSSYDSRYFGEISSTLIIAKATPLLTFGN